MIGSYAGIVFSVSRDAVKTFTGLTRTKTARFANHEVIGSKPKKEYSGPGLATASFSMYLSRVHGVDPVATIDKLDRFIEKGESSPLILGGRNYGEFVILSRSEDFDIILQSGAVVSCAITVEMEEYN